jgi:hypothetical protein
MGGKGVLIAALATKLQNMEEGVGFVPKITIFSANFG